VRKKMRTTSRRAALSGSPTCFRPVARVHLHEDQSKAGFGLQPRTSEQWLCGGMTLATKTLHAAGKLQND